MYFGMEPPLDRPVLTSDYGSNVLAGAKKNSLWDWNHCACHCLNIAMQSALKRSCIQKFVEPLVELACKFSMSRSLWMEFKKVQLEMLHLEAECRNNEGDVDFDGEEGAFLRCSRQATSKKGVEVVDTSVHTLELHGLHDTESAGAKELYYLSSPIVCSRHSQVRYPLPRRVLTMIALMLLCCPSCCKIPISPYQQ